MCIRDRNYLLTHFTPSDLANRPIFFTSRSNLPDMNPNASVGKICYFVCRKFYLSVNKQENTKFTLITIPIALSETKRQRRHKTCPCSCVLFCYVYPSFSSRFVSYFLPLTLLLFGSVCNFYGLQKDFFLHKKSRCLHCTFANADYILSLIHI